MCVCGAVASAAEPVRIWVFTSLSEQRMHFMRTKTFPRFFFSGILDGGCGCATCVCVKRIAISFGSILLYYFPFFESAVTGETSLRHTKADARVAK